MARLIAVLALLLARPAEGRVFGKCELATHLLTVHNMPREDLSTWVCIAEFESTFNSSAINTGNWDKSSDHGLFQLSNKFWCRDPEWRDQKNVCGLPCTDLLDDDITDDLRCARLIITETEKWKGAGTGLSAWVAYVNRCKDRNLNEYIEECATQLNEIETFPRKEEVSVTTEHQVEENEIKQIKEKEEVSVSTVPIIEENEIKQIKDKEEVSVSTVPIIEENETKQIKNKEEVSVSTVPIIEENEIKQIEDSKKRIPNMASHVVEFDHVKRPERKVSESHHIRDFTGHNMLHGNRMFKSSVVTPTVQFRSSVMAPFQYKTYNIFYTYPMLSYIPVYRNPQPSNNRLIYH